MDAKLVSELEKLWSDRTAIVSKVNEEKRTLTAEEEAQLTPIVSRIDQLERTNKEESACAQRAVQVQLMEQAAREAAGRGQVVGGVAEADFSEKDIANFSILRCMRLAAKKMPIDGLERRMSDHIADKTGQVPKMGGLFIPTRVLVGGPRQAIVTTSTGTGAVSTVTSSDYIDALRNRSIIGAAGFQIISNLSGKFAIPKVTTDHTAYWPGEGVASTISSTVLGSVSFGGKPVRAHQDFTPTFINQASLDVEMYARDSLVGVIAAAVGTAAVNGTGGSNTLLGLLNNTATGLVTLLTAAQATSGAIVTNLTGGAPTWASVVAMESVVGSQNVDITQGSYIGSWPARGACKSTAKASNAPLFICEDNVMNGYPFLATGGMPTTCGTNSSSAGLVFVNGPDVIIANWGQPEVLFDPYSLSTSGGLRVCIGQEVDLQLRHDGAVARMYGMAV